MVLLLPFIFRLLLALQAVGDNASRDIYRVGYILGQFIGFKQKAFQAIETSAHSKDPVFLTLIQLRGSHRFGSK